MCDYVELPTNMQHKQVIGFGLSNIFGIFWVGLVYQQTVPAHAYERKYLIWLTKKNVIDE
jgi:hypothetical protein